MNQVILIGNVGDVNHDNQKVGKERCIIFSLATSSKWNDKAGNEVVKTEWHKVIAIGTMAESLGKRVEKGTRLFVKGTIKYNEYTDKHGNKAYSTNIHVESFIHGIKD